MPLQWNCTAAPQLQLIYELSLANERLEREAFQLKQYVLDLRRSARGCGCPLNDSSGAQPPRSRCCRHRFCCSCRLGCLSLLPPLLDGWCCSCRLGCLILGPPLPPLPLALWLSVCVPCTLHPLRLHALRPLPLPHAVLSVLTLYPSCVHIYPHVHLHWYPVCAHTLPSVCCPCSAHTLPRAPSGDQRLLGVGAADAAGLGAAGGACGRGGRDGQWGPGSCAGCHRGSGRGRGSSRGRQSSSSRREWSSSRRSSSSCSSAGGWQRWPGADAGGAAAAALARADSNSWRVCWAGCQNGQQQ